MKKKILQLFFSLSFVLLFSQSKIIVKIAGSDRPLSQTSIYCNKKLLGITDAQGQLEFKTTSRQHLLEIHQLKMHRE